MFVRPVAFPCPTFVCAKIRRVSWIIARLAHDRSFSWYISTISIIATLFLLSDAKTVREIMTARVKKAADMNCDAIEPDNMMVSPARRCLTRRFHIQKASSLNLTGTRCFSFLNREVSRTVSKSRTPKRGVSRVEEMFASWTRCASYVVNCHVAMAQLVIQNVP